MSFNLQHNGIFVYTDPAGANAVLGMLKINVSKKNKTTAHKVYTHNEGILIQDFKQLITQLPNDINQIQSIIQEQKPNFIFSSTSLNIFEKIWWKQASEQNIRTIAFVDHWTSYKERFLLDGELIYPGEIWLVDDIAKNEAIKMGIPANKLQVTGNPYHGYIKNYNPEELRADFFKNNRLSINKRSILFIEDDIKRSFHSDGRGNCVLGYDEYTVLNDIFKKLELIFDNKTNEKEKFQLIIKLHPKSEKNKFDFLINEYIDKIPKVLVLQNTPSLDLLYYSDYVLGMFSNMVLESEIIGRKTLRVQTGQLSEDILNKKISNSKLVTNIDYLKNELLNFLF